MSTNPGAQHSAFPDTHSFVNWYAYELRNRADDDYIAARHSYWLALAPQFLWGVQQSLEKYLKCLILFHGGDVAGPSRDLHDLMKLFEKARYILVRERGLSFTFPNWLPDFLLTMTEFGLDRYCLVETYVIGHELTELDEAVWSIRRYCQFAPIPEHLPAQRRAELTRSYFDDLSQRRPPESCGVFACRLEKVLEESRDASSTLRHALHKDNVCFSDQLEQSWRWSGSYRPIWQGLGGEAVFKLDPVRALDELCRRIYLSKEERNNLLVYYGATPSSRKTPRLRKTRPGRTPLSDWVEVKPTL